VTRVAFLGPPASVGAHGLHSPAGGLEPSFIDVRAGADAERVLATLAHVAADVAVVLAPEVLPEGTLDGFSGSVVMVDASNGLWRGRPLPIDDRLYAELRPMGRTPRALFLGASTARRESILIHAKHAFDVVHYAHGLSGSALIDVLASTDVGIALNPGPEPGFPPAALLHLAAGHLLVSELPTPSCGLEAGADFLAIDSFEVLLEHLGALRERPDAFDAVRARGRRFAETHRASRVWPELVAELQGLQAGLRPR
jgi:hypothetical protein